MKGEIVRVWGRADAFDLSFGKRGDKTWETLIPPDMTDGQYAAEIFAEDQYGATALWSGILYMHSGTAHLHLNREKYTFWVLPMISLADVTKKTEIRAGRAPRICPLGDAVGVTIELEEVCSDDRIHV